MKITKNTNIGDLLEENPEAGKHLMEAGMSCIGCPMAQMESIENGCLSHGMEKEDIEKLIKKLNK